MTAAIFFSAFGTFLIWVVISYWRHRSEEKISLIEAVILNATGQEPLPLNRFDKWLQIFQIIFAAILGPLMLIVGIALLVDELGSLK